MPAETIYGNDRFDLRIAWGRDDDNVQMVTKVRDDEGYGRVIKMVNEWLAAAGMDSIDAEKLKAALEREPGKAGPWFDGWHWNAHDRRGVNLAIATLKRARDQAFGRDE